MAAQFIYNPTDSPVVVDDEGHTLGGGEWGWADSRDIDDAIEAGRLVKADPPAKDAAKHVRAAYDNKPTRRGAGSDSEKE
jgi:hypothetical protein